jgi:hypothetical protein
LKNHLLKTYHIGDVACRFLAATRRLWEDSERGCVAAVVDGHKIYRSELEKYFQNQIAGSDTTAKRGTGGELASEHS